MDDKKKQYDEMDEDKTMDVDVDISKEPGKGGQSSEWDETGMPVDTDNDMMEEDTDKTY